MLIAPYAHSSFSQKGQKHRADATDSNGIDGGTRSLDGLRSIVLKELFSRVPRARPTFKKRPETFIQIFPRLLGTASKVGREGRYDGVFPRAI